MAQSCEMCARMIVCNTSGVDHLIHVRTIVSASYLVKSFLNYYDLDSTLFILYLLSITEHLQFYFRTS